MENNINDSMNYLSDITNIYKQISIEPDMLFDVNDEKEFLIKCIETTFDKDFLLIETNLLLNDINKLNISFVNLIKLCKSQKTPYIKIHKIFIEYCDYFDLPYNKCFLSLHEKLQIMIKNGTIDIIGIEQFKKLDKLNNPNKVTTLFDLINK